jgi:hypothetical protein
MNVPRLSRRSLLGAATAGLSSALFPFIPAGARAQAGAAPKRLLVVFSPMGYLESGFFPSGSTSDFSLGETMTVLEPFKNQLIYLDGLSIYGAQWFFPDDDNEHGSGMAMCFTASKKDNYATGPSFEQLVADKLYAEQPTPFRALALGVNAPNPSGHTSCFFSAAQTPVNAQNSPSAAFDTLFRDLQTETGQDDQALMRRRAQKQSVIDLVRGELNSVCGRIGAQEQDKCEAHLAALRQLEMRVSGSLNVTECTKPQAPEDGDLVGRIESQMDIIASAFTCDLARVATLQLGFCDGGLDMIPGLNHHDITHATGDTKLAPDVVENHKRIDRWFADRWLYLLQKLSAVQELDGTLLDNTLIVFGSDTTTGTSNNIGAHQLSRFPFWLAGGKNFAFQTGRYLKYSNPGDDGSTEKAAAYQANSRLFVSVLQKFGIDRDTFGNMDPGSGALPML